MSYVRRIFLDNWFGMLCALCVIAYMQTRLIGEDYLLYGWDAQYYYSLAHSMAFDADLDITNNLLDCPGKVSYDWDGDGTFEQAPKLPSGQFTSKYPMGLSVFEYPFLQIGRLLRHIAVGAGWQTGSPWGYSRLEMSTVFLGLLLLFCHAMQLMYRLLTLHFSGWKVAIALLLAWGGTSMFFFTSIMMFMAHAAAFTCLTWIWVIWLKFREKPTPFLVILLAVLFGLLFWIRPQQILLLFPLALASSQPFLTTIRHQWWGWLAGIGVGLFMLLIQAYVYSRCQGYWTLFAYGATEERFSLLRPAWYIVLFGVDCGWFWHSPIVVFSLIGVLFRHAKLPPGSTAMLVHMLVQLYLVMTWSSPYQGYTFGCRMVSESMGIIAVGILVLFSLPYLRWLAIFASIICVIWTFTLIQLDYYNQWALNPLNHLEILSEVVGYWR
ncbi:MAG: hypothetical protein R3B84_04445 [Zavarzinella sp.]